MKLIGGIFMALFIHTFAKQRTCFKGDIVERTELVEVEMGQKNSLSHQMLFSYNRNLPKSYTCLVHLLQNDPVSQLAGRISHSNFSCHFREGSVVYEHFGAPLHLVTQDEARFIIYAFKWDCLVEQLVLVRFKVIPRPPKYFILQKNISVSSPGKSSNMISKESVAIVAHAFSEVDCFVRVVDGRWPKYGEVKYDKYDDIIATNKRISCNLFLGNGLLYKHLPKHKNASKDYVSFSVEILDTLTGFYAHENVFLEIDLDFGKANHPPKFLFKKVPTFDVSISYDTPLIPIPLETRDNSTNSDEIIYNITEPMSKNAGYITFLHQKWQPILSFTQKQLIGYEIGYIPVGENLKYSQMTLVAIDNEGAVSAPFVVKFKITKSQPLIFTLNRGLVVLQGHKSLITKDRFMVSGNKESMCEIQKNVNGLIKIQGTNVTSFTPLDVDDYRVIYEHNGNSSSDTDIDITISSPDGVRRRETLHVTVIAPDISPPMITSGMELLKVTKGRSKPIRLKAVDESCSSEVLVYDIIEEPKLGKIVLGAAFQQRRIVNTFTQADIEQGRVHYFAKRAGEDTFQFIVKDCAAPIPNQLPDVGKTLAFHTKNSNRGNYSPAMDNIISTYSIRLNENDVKLISLHNNTNTGSKDLTYRLVRFLHRVDPLQASNDAGHLIRRPTSQHLISKNNDYQEVWQFTQKDIDEKLIYYIPPAEDIGRNPVNVQFIFDVKETNSVTNGGIFTITILPMDNKSPDAIINALEVDEGSSVLLSQSNLKITDLDSDISKITIRISKFPKHGNLTLKGKLFNSSSQWFSQSYISHLNLRYEHNGGEEDYDSFEFFLSDSINEKQYLMPINIEQIDDKKPHLVPNLKDALFLKEGGSVNITKDVLFVRDIDTLHANLWYYVSGTPQKGKIYKGESVVYTFSQEDIIQNLISYRHNNFEIGTSQDSEVVVFRVTDQAYSDVHHSDALYLNVTMNISPVDNKEPTINMGNEFTTDECAVESIGPDVLYAFDRDSDKASIGFVVTKMPIYGRLHFKGSPKNLTSFVLEDINNLIVVYSQTKCSGIEPKFDHFMFRATDGVNDSLEKKFPITIRPINDEIPVFEVRNETVIEGSFIEIGDSLLSAYDNDIPTDTITFKFTKPMHGMISPHSSNDANIEPISEVSLQSLKSLENRIWYVHDNSETTSDEYVIEMSDGSHIEMKKVYIKVIPVNDQSPINQRRTGISVKVNSSVVLTRDALYSRDLDSSPSNVIYIIEIYTKYGTLQKYSPYTKKWNDIPDSDGTFTQDDINRGHIRYENNIPQAKDHFRFQLSDRINTHRQEYTFEIRILSSDKSQLILVNNGIQVNIDTTVTIGSDVLLADDKGTTAASDIIFTISEQPKLGRLYHLKDSPSRGFQLKKFSVADLIERKIYYTQNKPANDSADNFKFCVTNGQQFINGTFEIIIKSKYQHPTVLQNSGLTVPRGGRAMIGIQTLHVIDPDTKAPNLTFFITQLPAHGNLTRANRTIEKTFTQYEVDNYEIYYSHNGDDAEKDDFKYKVTDGINTGFSVSRTIRHHPMTFTIIIDKLPKKKLQFQMNMSLPLTTFKDRKGFTLTQNSVNESLAQWVVGSGYLPEMLVFTVVKAPKHGDLIHKLENRSIRSFTLADIRVSEIAYLISSSTRATEDQFVFEVKDPDDNKVTNQVFKFSWSAISFKSKHTSYCEDQGIVSIALERKGKIDNLSVARIEIKSISARLNEDFSLFNEENEVRFEKGSSSGSFRLKLFKDDRGEDVERFKFIISNVENGIIGENDTQSVTIIDETTGRCRSNHQDIGDLNKIGEPCKVNWGFNDHHQRFLKCKNGLWHVANKSDVIDGIAADETNLCASYNNWTHISGYCYFFKKTKVKANQAKRFCEKNNSTLAIIPTFSTTVLSKLFKLSKYRQFWIGLNRSNTKSWVWPNLEVPVPPLKDLWGQGSGAQAQDSKRICVNVMKNGKLKNRKCDRKPLPIMCSRRWGAIN